MGEKPQQNHNYRDISVHRINIGAASATLTIFLLSNEVKNTPTLCHVNYYIIIPFVIIVNVSVHSLLHFSQWISLHELLWFGFQAFSKLLLDLNVEL